MTDHPPKGAINPVLPEWLFRLPFQQQSVIILALRGPDGVRKHHPCKEIVRAYRGTVLVAAYRGRMLRFGEVADTFMSMDAIADPVKWTAAAKAYFDSVDELPHHYHLHLLHGAQLIGIHHPDENIANAWDWFYKKGCEDMHLTAETMRQVSIRLSDWHRENWD